MRRVCATAGGEAPGAEGRGGGVGAPRDRGRRRVFYRCGGAVEGAFLDAARARDTAFAVPRHAGDCGAISGRQRRQARKPACSAAAALAKKRQCSERRACRADGAAVDAGGGDADEETAIEARIASLERAIADIGIKQDKTSAVPSRGGMTEYGVHHLFSVHRSGGRCLAILGR